MVTDRISRETEEGSVLWPSPGRGPLAGDTGKSVSINSRRETGGPEL